MISRRIDRGLRGSLLTGSSPLRLEDLSELTSRRCARQTRCPRELYKELSQSSRVLFSCHEGMLGTGEGSVIFSNALRFISRLARA
jgi:hypothetical protein